MDFFVASVREASWKFPRQEHEFKEFRGFPGMELGIFRVARSSGEGRDLKPCLCTLSSSVPLIKIERKTRAPPPIFHPRLLAAPAT